MNEMMTVYDSMSVTKKILRSAPQLWPRTLIRSCKQVKCRMESEDILVCCTRYLNEIWSTSECPGDVANAGQTDPEFVQLGSCNGSYIGSQMHFQVSVVSPMTRSH